MELPYDPVIPLLGIYLEIWNTNSKEYKHHYVHCSIINNSEDLEAAQVSISRWVDKNLWYIYTMEYYMAVKKKEILLYSNSVDGTRRYYAE